MLFTGTFVLCAKRLVKFTPRSDKVTFLLLLKRAKRYCFKYPRERIRNLCKRMVWIVLTTKNPPKSSQNTNAKVKSIKRQRRLHILILIFLQLWKKNIFWTKMFCQKSEEFVWAASIYLAPLICCIFVPLLFLNENVSSASGSLASTSPAWPSPSRPSPGRPSPGRPSPGRPSPSMSIKNKLFISYSLW